MFSEVAVDLVLTDKNGKQLPFISHTTYLRPDDYMRVVDVRLDVDWERFEEFCEEYERAPSLDSVIRQWRNGNENIQNHTSV